MKDTLGDRIKTNYEDRSRVELPRRTYVICRVDGKAFHTYTKDCDRPFDAGLASDMNQTALSLCQNIGGAQLAFVQSDEISILITDFAKTTTQAWFDNNIQKMSSVSASLATTAFNKSRLLRIAAQNPAEFDWANFDSRCFSIPDPAEVFNYFVWRQSDAIRNSVSMAARAKFSHNSLNGKHVGNMKQMLIEVGAPWEELNQGFRNGRVILKRESEHDIEFTNKKTQVTEVLLGVKRSEWVVEDAPIFTADKSYLNDVIPKYGETND